MPIRFCCLRCGKTLAIGRRKAGTQVACPKCGQEQIVPPPAAPPGAGAVPPPLPTPEDDAAEPETIMVYDEIPPLLDAPSRPRPGDCPNFRLSENGTVPFTDTPFTGTPIGPEWLLLRRRTLYLQAGLIAAVGLVGLLAGYFMGRFDASVDLVANHRDSARQPVLVEGKLTARDAGGHATDDWGAVVVFLPQTRRPDVKISTAGLGPDAPAPPSDLPAVARIRELGGVYARADRQGTFSVVLPDRGRYNVLLVSAKANRPEGSLIEQVDLDELARYFHRPERLIGCRQYRWTVRDLANRARLDHAFRSR
ncbi:MAG: hypothetical protein JW809_10275 [Pirellulales bacterium]|nr:hypothetical protein [Pirellulales bacterium]